MRKVIFGGANSLDNYIAREDGSYDWILWGDEAAELMKDMWSRFDTIVMGRKTYDVAAGGSAKTKRKKAKNPYGDMRSIVFSRTLKPAEHDGVEIIADDPGKVHQKAEAGKG